MKFTLGALSVSLLLLACRPGSAFQPARSASIMKPTTELSMANQNQNAWWALPVATAVAGWTLASQVALASIMPPMATPQQGKTTQAAQHRMKQETTQ
jgi:hypothetical protein